MRYQKNVWQKQKAKYDENNYANVGTICKYFGYTPSRKILQYYAIIGCYGTSFFYINGRINTFKEVLKNSSCLRLIEWLGKNKSLSNTDIENLFKLFVKMEIIAI